MIKNIDYLYWRIYYYDGCLRNLMIRTKVSIAAISFSVHYIAKCVYIKPLSIRIIKPLHFNVLKQGIGTIIYNSSFTKDPSATFLKDQNWYKKRKRHRLQIIFLRNLHKIYFN